MNGLGLGVPRGSHNKERNEKFVENRHWEIVNPSVFHNKLFFYTELPKMEREKNTELDDMTGDIRM